MENNNYTKKTLNTSDSSLVHSRGLVGGVLPDNVVSSPTNFFKEEPLDLTHDNLRRDCLLIAFNPSATESSNLENSDVRNRRIRLARKLLEELEEARYEEW